METVDTAAVTPAAVEAPSTPAPESTASMSDEQILGIGEETASVPTEQAAPAEPTPEAAAAVDPAAVPPVDAGKLDYRRVPDDLRELVKANPALENYFMDALGLRDLGMKIDDIKALREAVGEGGLGGLTAMKAELDEARGNDAKFFSTDPAQQSEVVSGLFAENPAAVVSAFRATSQLLSEKAPEQYSEIAGEVVRSTLAGAGFDSFAQKAAAAISSGDAAAQGQLLQQFLGWLQENAKIGLSQEQTLSMRETALNQREESSIQASISAEASKTNEFNGSISTQVTTSTDAAINAALDKLLPQGFNPKFRDRITKEAADAIEKAVKTNPQVQEGIANLWKSKVLPANFKPNPKAPMGLQLTPENQKELADYIVGAANQLVAPTLAKILPEWVENFSATQKEKNARTDRANSRVDITSGAGSPSLTPRKVDYTKHSDDDILGM